MKIPGLLLCLCAFSACTQMQSAKKAPETSPHAGYDPTQIPQDGVTTPINAAGPVGKKYSVQTEKDLMAIDNGMEEGDVTFTNADNPNEDIAAITAAFSKRGSMQDWTDKYTKALEYSRREGLPIIIWFHDSFLNPASIKLGQELMDTGEFDTWAKNKIVRLKLDSGIRTRDPDDRSRGLDPDFINGRAAQFGVRTRPAVIVMSASGKVQGTLTGYDPGNGDAYLADLKRYVKMAEKDFIEFKKTLEPKGYRTWHGARDDTTLFAKLQKYDADQKLVWLREFDGRVTCTREQLLSQPDLDWIQQQKAAYEASSGKKKATAIP